MPQRLRGRVADAAVEALTARLPSKAAALFFAIVLWVVASGDEPAARYVDVRFAPAVDGDARLLGAPPRVRALVVGPARELLKLYAAPPVLRRAVSGDGDVARLELRPGDVDLPSGVGGVVVRDVRPRSVALRLEALAARRVPVRVAVRAEDGVLPPESDFVVDPDSVLVRGPRGLIQSLAAVPTEPRVVARGEALDDVALDTAAVGVRATPARVRLLIRTRPAAAQAAPAPATRAAPAADESEPGEVSSEPARPAPGRPARDPASRDSAGRRPAPNVVPARARGTPR